MQRKLTITIDEAVCEGLYVRPHVLDADLDTSYEEMARDQMRERDAEEWSEAMLDNPAGYVDEPK